MVKSIECLQMEETLGIKHSFSGSTIEEQAITHFEAQIAIYGHVKMISGTFRRLFSPNAHVFKRYSSTYPYSSEAEELCLGH